MKLILSIGFSAFMVAFGYCVMPLKAEIIKLTNGQIIEAKIVEETDDYIRIMDEAGFISKYPRLEIETIGTVETPSLPASQPIEAQPQPKQQVSGNAQEAVVDGVRAQLQENLKKTETMVQETLRRLYDMPEYQATFGNDQEKGNITGKRNASRLQEERDRKYKKHKKYY